MSRDKWEHWAENMNEIYCIFQLFPLMGTELHLCAYPCLFICLILYKLWVPFLVMNGQVTRVWGTGIQHQVMEGTQKSHHASLGIGKMIEFLEIPRLMWHHFWVFLSTDIIPLYDADPPLFLLAVRLLVDNGSWEYPCPTAGSWQLHKWFNTTAW